jgi:transcriptional regulator with XRE-family HTH domain
MSAPFRIALGVVLREARKGKRLSQAALAKRLRVAQSYVSRVERGRMNLPVTQLFHWAQALDTFPSALLKKAEAAFEVAVAMKIKSPRVAEIALALARGGSS